MPDRIHPTKITATEHLVREYFGDPKSFGMRFPLPKGFHANAAKLVLAIAGADGKLSPSEREACEASARFWGASDADVREISSFDPSKTTIEKLVAPELRSAAAMMLYDGVRIARVDGFQEKERAATVRAAKALGLEATIVPAIEGLLALDSAVRDARNRLLQVPPEHSGSGALMPPHMGRAIEYGSPGGVPLELMMRIPEAIKIVCAGDGDVTEAELAWLVGQGRVVGMPDEGVEALLKFDTHGKRIEDYVDEAMRPYARLILFDAIRAARVDGFHQREREMAQRAAKTLGLDDTFVVAMENQILTEDALREARFRVLATPEAG